jgi:multimeric flavodoxin WrbA
MKAGIIYWSATGNTKKVTETIHDTLKNRGIDADIKTVKESTDTDLHDYDLVFIGAPSYMWSPPDPVRQWIVERMGYYRDKKAIKPGAPIIPGKKAVVFVTYSGPHTGVDEAIPAGEYIGQFLAHIGFDVVDKWYIVGEFHNSVENSTLGRLGDIRGRPNREDLDGVAKDVEKVLGKISG